MNSTFRLIPVAGAAALAVAISGCSSVDLYGQNAYPGPAPVTSPAGTYSQPMAAVEFGRVTNVSLVSGTAPATSNRGVAGAAIGAIVGGLLGSQIGGGSGRTAATVVGAVGGAVAGNQIARRSDGSYATAQPVYRIEVQTDAGAIRTYDVAATGDLRPGDRVRIENGVIYLA